MSAKPRPAVIGAFVLGGLALILLAVILWGSGRLFTHRDRFICYFSGSVNGLGVGAQVKYRGVPIGSVVGERIRFEQSADDQRIPVFIELNSHRVRELGVAFETPDEAIHRLIGRGLRARLELESLVTSQLYVNLDLFPDAPPVQVHARRGFPEIPTIPTALEEVGRSVLPLLAQLRELDLAGTMRSLASVVDGIDRIVHTPALAATLRELPGTVASVRTLAQGLDRTVGSAGRDLSAALGELRALTAARGPLLLELERTLTQVQRAADAVRILAELLQRNPSVLIFGKPKR